MWSDDAAVCVELMTGMVRAQASGHAYLKVRGAFEELGRRPQDPPGRISSLKPS
jgi:hypothetical protein